MPYRSPERPAWARLLEHALRGLDAVAARLGARHAWSVSAEVSRRSLWGALPARTAAPPGPPLLALSFDLDYQADTDALGRLVDVVDRVGARMSVVAVGRLVEADPGPYREAVAEGHEIVNHTYNHPDNPVLCPDRAFWDLSVDEMDDEIGRAQDAFAGLLGVRPTGFRSPHFKDAPRMLEALARHPEIRYVSTALASKAPIPVPYHPAARPLAGMQSLHFSAAEPSGNSGLLMIPLTPCPAHRWSPFCSYHAIRRPADPARGCGMHSLDDFEALWRRMLGAARAGGFASVYFDPMDVMRDEATAAAFERMLTTARAAGWTLTTLADVAGRWDAHLDEAREVAAG